MIKQVWVNVQVAFPVEYKVTDELVEIKSPGWQKAAAEKLRAAGFPEYWGVESEASFEIWCEDCSEFVPEARFNKKNMTCDTCENREITKEEKLDAKGDQMYDNWKENRIA